MKNNLVKYLWPLGPYLLINLAVVIYWLTKCRDASSVLEDFFYCSVKDGYSLIVLIIMCASIAVFVVILCVSLLISYLAKNKNARWIRVTLGVFLALGTIVFVLTHCVWLAPGTITFEQYKVQRENDLEHFKQKQKEYLNSAEYKELSDKSFQKSCEWAIKAKLDNPNVLIPIDCKGIN
jgi:hypothetical protein